jgi:putative FmdB family regulatory protein
MPLYDYRCASCGNFREIRPMAESGTPRACPSCGTSCARLLSAPFLAGNDQNGQGGNRRTPQGRVPWRTACGLGCSHVH